MHSRKSDAMMHYFLNVYIASIIIYMTGKSIINSFSIGFFLQIVMYYEEKV
jgi:hypothetical protein